MTARPGPARPDPAVLFHYYEIASRLSRRDGGRVYNRSPMSIGKSAGKQRVTVGFEIRRKFARILPNF